MRTIWKGAISFGLVHIPANLYPAVKTSDISFRYLHSKCGTPVKYKKFCPACEKEVSPDEISRGYEYERDKFVTVTKEETESIPQEANKAVNIVSFVNLSDIDPVYFEKTYYIAPGRGGEKAYELLRTAMERTRMAAIGRVVIRSRENLAALRVYNKAIAMETMHYPDEIRPLSGMAELHYNVNVRQNELEMAEGLISNLSEGFDPGSYENEYSKALMQIIEGKIAGRQVTIPASPRGEEVMDLVDALKASINMTRNKTPVER